MRAVLFFDVPDNVAVKRLAQERKQDEFVTAVSVLVGDGAGLHFAHISFSSKCYVRRWTVPCPSWNTTNSFTKFTHSTALKIFRYCPCQTCLVSAALTPSCCYSVPKHSLQVVCKQVSKVLSFKPKPVRPPRKPFKPKPIKKVVKDAEEDE